MQYYQDINIWTLYGDALEVTEDNEHLGMTVSGQAEKLRMLMKTNSSAEQCYLPY